jgi:23S rRNA (uracil-5-)-methyltransferase RumA
VIESNKQLKQYYANKLQQLSASRTPLCKHFGECGGCAWQHIDYPAQVELKSEALSEIMSEYSQTKIQVVPSPMEYNYRARMDYVCSFDPFHPPTERLGLRKRKQFRHVIDLEECHLIDPKLFLKVRTIYNFARELEIPLYDLVSSKGELRYMVVRTGGEQSMLIIITRSTDLAEQIEKVAELALQKGFDSIQWSIQPELSDISFGKIEKYWGTQYLNMKVGNDKVIKLEIGPNNFFQNNIPLFNQLLDYVSANIKEGSLLLDLYCGVGTIGIALAHKFQSVIGVELEAESVTLATKNALCNHVSNITFHAGDVASLEQQVALGELDTSRATVVLDPPRAGLTPKGVAEVSRLNPRQIIYISCNPITQAQDLKLLTESYTVRSIYGFDMFPQTPHLESVVILER